MIELSLPAGSMQAALAAFDGGADSVYLGLERYSARAAAANFSFEELSALRAFCIEHKKRCYVTLNTLLDEESLPAIVPTLRRLSFIGCDGVIVQDLAGPPHQAPLPTLPLHASTQLAVHTTEGSKSWRAWGLLGWYSPGADKGGDRSHQEGMPRHRAEGLHPRLALLQRQRRLHGERPDHRTQCQRRLLRPDLPLLLHRRGG